MGERDVEGAFMMESQGSRAGTSQKEDSLLSDQAKSPWQSFFEGGRSSPRNFLARLRRDAFPVPTDEELARTAQIVADRRGGLPRLLSLFRLTAGNGNSISDTI